MNTLFGDIDSSKPEPQQAVEKQIEKEYIVLAESLTDLLDEISNDRLCKGITFYRQSDGNWLVSGNMRDQKSWNCVVAPDISTGIATLHQREKFLRDSWGPDNIDRYVYGTPIA